MSEIIEFSEYSFIYSKTAKPLRRALHASLRPTLDEIEDMLSDDPDKFPNRIIPLGENLYIYKHPAPHIEITYRVDRQKKVLYILHLVAPVMETSKPLFISYSHQDEEWLTQLRKWLKPLEKEDMIKIWDDKEIKAGDNWRKEIEKALNSAKVAILLISQDFLASDFITDVELPKLLEAAEEKGVKIFWIAVKDSTVEDSELAKYQAVHKTPPLFDLDPRDLDKQFLRIYKTIKEAVN